MRVQKFGYVPFGQRAVKCVCFDCLQGQCRCAVLLEKSVSMMKGTKGPSWQVKDSNGQSHNFTFPNTISALGFARVVSRQSAVGTFLL